MRRRTGRVTLEGRLGELRSFDLSGRRLKAVTSLGCWILLPVALIVMLGCNRVYDSAFEHWYAIGRSEFAPLLAMNTSDVFQDVPMADDVPSNSSGAKAVNTGARFPNGTEGYVADPTALKRGIASFLRGLEQEVPHHVSLERFLGQFHPELYWTLMSDYQAHFRCGNPTGYWKELTTYPGHSENCSTYSGTEILSSDYVCAGGPGQGFEGQGGYKLLAEKIRVHGVDTFDEGHHERSPPVRILCAMYTYHRMRDLARAQAISWGHKCDGFLAFSTETIPKLGMLELIHDGPESYDNMWQKTRSIWAYIAQHYLGAYDFFHLGGDDLYLIVENLRKYLSDVRRKRGNDSIPLYLGQWISKSSSYFVGGAPGYTINRAALARLVKDVLPICMVKAKLSWEDRTLSNCFRDTIGLSGHDTRDSETGQQTYHDCGPDQLYTFRSASGRGSFHAKSASFWETLPHPNPGLVNKTVGPKHGLEAAATLSINLHDLYNPLYTARIHSILYHRTCPSMSALGQALNVHKYHDDQ